MAGVSLILADAHDPDSHLIPEVEVAGNPRAMCQGLRADDGKAANPRVAEALGSEAAAMPVAVAVVLGVPPSVGFEFAIVMAVPVALLAVVMAALAETRRLCLLHLQ